eukprot:Sdes_comp9098_c0_seq1m559
MGLVKDLPLRYIISIIVQPPASNYLRGFQNAFKDLFVNDLLLKSPVQIPLQPPFCIEESNEELLSESIKEKLSGKTPYQISLDGFGRFSNSIIYCKPLQDEAEKRLRKDQSEIYSLLKTDFGVTHKGLETGYNPHVAIAKNLNCNNFASMWKNFQEKNFKLTFPVDRYCLLKEVRHPFTNRSHYVFHQEFPFGGSV